MRREHLFAACLYATALLASAVGSGGSSVEVRPAGHVGRLQQKRGAGGHQLVALEAGGPEAALQDEADSDDLAKVQGPIKNHRGECLTAKTFAEGAQVLLDKCSEGNLAQMWAYDSAAGQIKIQDLCLNAAASGNSGDKVYLAACEDNLVSQMWAYDAAIGLIKNQDGICLDAMAAAGGEAKLGACDEKGQVWSLLVRLAPPEATETSTTTVPTTSTRSIASSTSTVRATTSVTRSANASSTTFAKGNATNATVTNSSNSSQANSTNGTRGKRGSRWGDYYRSTTSLLPVGACVDLPDTGIRFRAGGKATCAELVNYCDHPSLGRKVKEACVKTCGRCSLSTMSSASVDCVDKSIDVAPVITIGGVPKNCTELKPFCAGHPDSEYVLRKCPLTCLFCFPVTTTTTTSTWSFSASPPAESNVNGLGCSRRRRWGFCTTRRRRMGS